jgi:hypothetical protein
MRPTESPPPRSERPSDELIEELCLALRDVGVATQFLPFRGPEPDIEKQVDRVQAVSRELQRREVDPGPRLDLLTAETGWSMGELLDECRKYPAARPWMRSTKDGLRIAMRCVGCAEHEFPSESRRIRLCDRCLETLDAALVSRTGSDHMLLYRTYTRDARCEHAGDETVLGVYPWSPEWSEDFPVGLCRECVSEEVKTRRGR